jgi:NAD(P)-dependent dehydrogenase (short-subunit alcohol dehydrogenase family)
MTKWMDFDGRTAVITGAGSGIGAALAADLSARGCHLALADINPDSLRDVAQQVARPDRRTTATLVDVGNSEAIGSFYEAVRADHGEAHLLFNNAGVALGGAFERIAVDDFEWLVNINFWGVVRMTRAFLPLLHEADRAHITNVSSIFGVIAPAGQTAYSASKFAVRGFTDALRHEFAGSNIGVTTVHPGGIATQIAKNARVPADATVEEIERGREQAARNLVMPPAKAAATILRGVERKHRRVLIGRDAHALALIERSFPARYWSLIRNLVGSE